MRLRDKLKIEKTHSNNLKSVFLKKGWEFDYCNNSFVKKDKVAYFYKNKLIFHFLIPIAKNKFNPTHTINL